MLAEAVCVRVPRWKQNEEKVSAGRHSSHFWGQKGMEGKVMKMALSRNHPLLS